MKKLLNIFCLFLVMFSLVSCQNRELPEGEIKNFIENFDYDKAYSSVSSMESIITSKTLEFNDEVGSIISTTNFINKENEKYYYLKKEVSGNYIGSEASQYQYKSDETLAYIKDDTVIATQKLDDTLSELKYQKEDVIRSITNTFYLELESGFHRGGVYFGDYVLVNAYKFYDHFKITEDNLLDYSINVASKNELGEEIVTMHHYTLNNLGIIVNLETKSINKKTKEQVITTITTVINQNIDRIWEL